MFCFKIADDQSHPGLADSSVRIGEGSRIVQGLLQQVYWLSQEQNAKRKFITKRLQSSRTRHRSIKWQQRQQSTAG